MNERFENAFGSAPPEFEAAMRRAIEMRGQGRARRPGARELLIAAALIALLCGAAYAMAKGLGILDMLKIRLGVTPAAEHMVQTGISQQGGDLEHATFTLEQAISDGRMVYFTVRAAPNDPDGVILLDDLQPPTELVETGEDITYAELADAQGKQLMRALVSGVSVNDEPYPEFQEIGAVRDGNDFVYACYVVAETQTDEPLNLTVRVDTSYVYGTGPVEHGVLTAQIRPENRAVGYRWTEPVLIEELGIEVTCVRVTDTPVVRFGEIRYRVLPTEDEAQLATAYSARLSIRSEQGEEVETLGGTEEELGDQAYAVCDLLPPVERFERLVVGVRGRGGFEQILAFDVRDAQKEEAK